ncbi:MAG: response regulator [Gemmatimonadota bacterium]|nr:response regulator [Gemmatimonadota bacterium]
MADSLHPNDPPRPARPLTVLIVDDEEAIRAIVSRVVTNNGHVVLDAHHGADALRVAAAHDGPIDLVISDMYMPGMRGPEIVEELRRQRPGIRALYMSGYGEEDVVRSGVLPGESFLRKPFNGIQIMVAIASAMGDRSSADSDA